MDDRRDMKILRLAGARKTSEDIEKREGGMDHRAGISSWESSKGPKSEGRLMGPEVGGKEIPASGAGEGKNKGRGQEMEDVTGQ